MKKVAICVATAVFLLFNWMALGFSETDKSVEDLMKDESLIIEQEYIAAKKHKTGQKHPWELGAEISHITYKEPDVMRDKGMMYGIAGSYAYHENLMLKAEGRFSYGQVDYKNSGTMNNIDDYILEIRGLGGYDFYMFEASTLTLYIGIGYRYLNDDSSGKITSTGAGGYERESNYIYSPVGIESVTSLKNGWSVGARGEYDIFWWGKQISHLSDANPNFGDVRNTQRRGYGLRGSIKLEKNGEKLDFIIEPFIRYWNIAKSNDSDVTYAGVIIGYGYEPKNNSTEIGCKLAAKF